MWRLFIRHLTDCDSRHILHLTYWCYHEKLLFHLEIPIYLHDCCLL